jgi:hypothetical protein
MIKTRWLVLTAVVVVCFFTACAGSKGYSSKSSKGCGCAAKKGMVGY